MSVAVEAVVTELHFPHAERRVWVRAWLRGAGLLGGVLAWQMGDRLPARMSVCQRGRLPPSDRRVHQGLSARLHGARLWPAWVWNVWISMHLSVHIWISLSIYLFIYLRFCLFIYLQYIYLSIYLSGCLLTYLFYAKRVPPKDNKNLLREKNPTEVPVPKRQTCLSIFINLSIN